MNTRKISMVILLLFIAWASLALTSCASGPVARIAPDGSVTVSTGGSVASHRKGVAATVSVKGGDITMTYAVEDEDSGSALANYFTYKGFVAGVMSWFGSKTAIATGAQATERAALKAATDQIALREATKKALAVPEVIP